jgi:LPXTG-motif cell wall-anchored protein
MLFYLCLFLFLLFVIPINAQAIKFDLIAPTGQLSRGQDIQFTINIDTQGANVASQEIGFTYDTQYLSYVSINPGTAMTSVTTSDQGGGKLLLSGANSTGFSGTGSFAIVTLNLIATSAGSTNLCALWSPQPTATTAPVATSAVQPTAPPPPPRTGSTDGTVMGLIAGTILIIGTAGLFIYRRSIDRQHRSSLKKR